MMTYNKNGAFYGLKDDPKPTSVEFVKGSPHPIENGTKLYEIDTGKEYRWDAQNNRWRLIESSGGSGGGGDGEQYIDITDTPF